MQFFTLDSSKIEVFKTCFFDMVTTEYDHPSYPNHVLGRVYMFFTLFGYWVGGGGVFQGMGTQPADAVFHFFFFCKTSPKSLLESPQEASHLPRDSYTTCLCSFSPWTAQKSKFSKLIFLILRPPKRTIHAM